MPKRNVPRILCFVAIAFAASWGSFWLLSRWLPPAASIAALVVFMFGPLVAALVTAAIFDRGRIIELLALRPRLNRWWLVAWAAPVVLIGLAWALSLLVPGVEPRSLEVAMAAAAEQRGVTIDPATLATLPPPLVLVGLAAVFGGAINTFAAIGEEAGWRGYLWSLMRPAGFWRATLGIGIIWGLWHTPAIVAGHNYGAAYFGYPWLGVGTMVLFTLGLSPLLGLIRERTGTSWAPALFHGTLNAVGGLAALGLAGGGPLVVGITGLVGTAVLAATSIAVAVVHARSQRDADVSS